MSLKCQQIVRIWKAWFVYLYNVWVWPGRAWSLSIQYTCRRPSELNPGSYKANISEPLYWDEALPLHIILGRYELVPYWELELDPKYEGYPSIYMHWTSFKEAPLQEVCHASVSKIKTMQKWLQSTSCQILRTSRLSNLIVPRIRIYELLILPSCLSPLKSSKILCCDFLIQRLTNSRHFDRFYLLPMFWNGTICTFSQILSIFCQALYSPIVRRLQSSKVVRRVKTQASFLGIR